MPKPNLEMIKTELNIPKLEPLTQCELPRPTQSLEVMISWE